MDQHLIELITKLVIEQMQKEESSSYEVTQRKVSHNASSIKATDDSQQMIDDFKSRMSQLKVAEKGNNPKEVVIGLGAAFQDIITKTISGIPHEDVIESVCAGIEEEGMVPRLVKIMDTSDVCFMALEAAKLSGSGIGIGIQSKGTTVIHQKDLYPLSNLELFPQAPLMRLETYRKIGQNAAKYVKGEGVEPIPGENNPMVRAEFQVKAAIMHIKETQLVTPKDKPLEWRR